jgi:nucleotide-binding universal stress UspA family protein
MYQRILVPIDGSSTANRGVDEAIGLAKLAGAQVRLLHVLDELIFVTGFETGATYISDLLPKLKEGGEAILEDARRRVEAAGVPVETHLMECLGSRTSDIVVEQAKAWKADVIVLGTHGRRGIGRWLLGSDAEQILRSAKVPVLLVRGEPEAQSAVARTAAETAATAAARLATATV